MKTIKFGLYLLLIAVILTSCRASTSAYKEEKAASEWERVQQAIQSNEYSIAVDQMIPTGGLSKTLVASYSLAIRNDSVFSHLPYFGRAYSVPYGGGNVVIFDAPATDYQVDKKGNKRIEITFKAYNEGDNLTFRVTLFANAVASITITFNNRQPISYRGYLVLT